MVLGLGTAGSRVMKRRRWVLECSPALLENDDNVRYEQEILRFLE